MDQILKILLGIYLLCSLFILFYFVFYCDPGQLSGWLNVFVGFYFSKVELNENRICPAANFLSLDPFLQSRKIHVRYNFSVNNNSNSEESAKSAFSIRFSLSDSAYPEFRYKVHIIQATLNRIISKTKYIILK